MLHTIIRRKFVTSVNGLHAFQQADCVYFVPRHKSINIHSDRTPSLLKLCPLCILPVLTNMSYMCLVWIVPCCAAGTKVQPWVMVEHPIEDKSKSRQA